jgi:hypothetical protein
MTILRNQWDVGRSAVKPDRVRKHKGKSGEKAAQAAGFLQFRALNASRVPPISGRYCLITIGDSTLTLSVSEIEIPRPSTHCPGAGTDIFASHWSSLRRAA